jgi:hypothetical protein
MEQLTMLQDQQVAAVINSEDDDFTGFDSLIRLAPGEKESGQSRLYLARRAARLLTFHLPDGSC